MILKVYQKYLTKEFVITSFKIIFIFFVLGFIMGILEEIKFFSDFEVPYYYPLYLVTLNIPSLIYEIFPFIFLITSQLYFLKLHEKNELHTFKINGLTNFKLLKIIITTSMILGFLIITIFYNFAATLKFQYLDIKKDYTKDNKYLATITENGLWIKDQIDDQINFVNAKKFSLDLLEDVDIIQLTNNFEFLRNIKSKKVNISDNKWIIYDAKIIENNNIKYKKDEMRINSNFDYKEINSLFANLSSLNLWDLIQLKKSYEAINYSTTEVNYHIQRIFAYPFLITIITLLTSILMINVNAQKPKIIFIVLGIILSVFIYYVNSFFGTLGKNEKIPLLISIWSPIIILSIISIIGLVKINDK